MGSPAKKQNRVEFRIRAEDKALLEQAAAIKGQSLSAYATSTLLEDARSIVVHAHRIELSERDRLHFFAIIDRDEEPNAALKAAARRYRASQKAAKKRS